MSIEANQEVKVICAVSKLLSLQMGRKTFIQMYLHNTIMF